MKSRSRPIPVILTISREITQKFANLSLKIGKNFHSRISQVPQMVKHEITFTLNSRRF